MTKKELLEIVIKLQDRVADLEKRIKDLEGPYPKIIPTQPFEPIPIVTPFVQDLCADGQPHEYESPWWGVTPPPCKKCDKGSEPFIITCDSSGPTIAQCSGCGPDCPEKHSRTPEFPIKIS